MDSPRTPDSSAVGPFHKNKAPLLGDPDSPLTWKILSATPTELEEEQTGQASTASTPQDSSHPTASPNSSTETAGRLPASSSSASKTKDHQAGSAASAAETDGPQRVSAAETTEDEQLSYAALQAKIKLLNSRQAAQDKRLDAVTHLQTDLIGRAAKSLSDGAKMQGQIDMLKGFYKQITPRSLPNNERMEAAQDAQSS